MNWLVNKPASRQANLAGRFAKSTFRTDFVSDLQPELVSELLAIDGPERTWQRPTMVRCEIFPMAGDGWRWLEVVGQVLAIAKMVGNG